MDVEDKMDPVNKKELKGTHAQRKDKDIDNDGDVDSTDKYLHKRRKAITKNIKGKKGETAEMNPKMKTDKEKGADMSQEQKESTIRDKLIAVLERSKEYKGATKPEGMHDKSSEGGKKMMDQPVNKDDTEEKGHDDASKAGRVTNSPKLRPADNSAGDKKIINKVKEAYLSMAK